MKEQLNCLQDNFSLTKDVIIDAYSHAYKKDSGKVVYHTNIFDSWTIDLFISMNVIAWKYIQLPKWILVQDFERAIQMKRF